jgi:serine/threonine-protein kinase
MQTIQEFDVFKNEFSNFALLDRGGQKVVYNAIHPEYGSVVVKFFFKEDERSIREININNIITLNCIPIIYQTGQVIYEEAVTLFIIEQKIEGEELRKKIVKGERFNLKQAVDFLEQGLLFIKQLEYNKIVHTEI